MIDVQLLVNLSERNKINKSLTQGPTLQGALREASPVVDPIITLEIEDPTGYNYVYIPAFGRYYYIQDMLSMMTGLWQLSLHCDPLMSFRDQLLGVSCILDATTDTGSDEYLAGSGQWVAKQKELTDIITFPQGLPQEGEFILITAGG